MKIVTSILFALTVLLTNHVAANQFNVQKWTTKNGVPVVFYPTTELPMLDISLAFAAGSAFDGPHHGMSLFTTRMLNQGNSGQNATLLAEALANTGAQYDAENSRDMVTFNLRTLTNEQALNPAIQVFSKIINHPDFPEAAFKREKRQLLMAIEQSKESPEEIASIHFFKALYQDHPYAHPLSGTTETISAINKEQLIDFYKRYYVTNNAVLVMVGAVDSPKAHQLAEQITQDLHSGDQAPAIPKATPLAKTTKLHFTFPSSQTMVRMGQIGIDHQNPHYFPLMVGNYILGGGSLISRLGIEVREKRGLTYGIDSQIVPMPGAGPFLISLSTKNNQTKTALKVTQDTLQEFIDKGPEQKELDAAKLYLTGSFPVSLSGNRTIASLLQRIAFYHLPDDYLDTYVQKIQAVTRDEIQLAFKEQFNTNQSLLVTVGRS